MPEWRNTFNRGFLCELAVVQALKKKSFQVLYHHCKCAHVELDILATHAENELWIVEVKSSSYAEYAALRLGVRQKQRLERAAALLLSVGFCVRVVLALVDSNRHIDWYDAISLDSLEDFYALGPPTSPEHL